MSPQSSPSFRRSTGWAHGFPWLLCLAAMSFACRCSCQNVTFTAGDGGNSGDGSTRGDGGTSGNGDAGGPQAGIGPGQWNPNPQNSTGVTLTDGGALVLTSQSDQTDYAWIANCTGAQVSKIDTSTGKEVARYWAVIPVDGQGNPNGLAPSPAGGCFTAPATSPSRTAVDLNGDVFVANRAPDTQPSATKIANIQLECIDRNGDGQITTSSDLNGDGVIEPATEMFPPADSSGNPSPPAGKNLGDPSIYDECVLWSQPVGGTGAGIGARAIVIDQGVEGSAGNVWVGIHKEAKFYKLDNASGALQPVGPGLGTSVDIPFGPYGAVIDGQARLWAVGVGTGHLTMIDTRTGIADGVDRYTNSFACSCLGSYGVGIDGSGRIWMAGWTSGSYAYRYDPSQDPAPTSPSVATAWTQFDLSGATGPGGTQLFGRPRGVAADDKGVIWVSADHDGTSAVAHLVAFNGDTPGCTSGTCTPVYKTFNTTGGVVDYVDATDSQTSTAIGVGLTSTGNAWVNAYSGSAIGVDRNTGAITKRYLGGPGSSGFGQTNLYTYSDFTGYALRHFTAPRGWYNSVFPGCVGDTLGTNWLTLSWVADTSMCANNTKCQIEVYVKVANTASALNLPTTKQYGPFNTSPVNLAAAGVPPDTYILVQVVLISLDHVTSPILDSVNLTWNCPTNFK